MKPGDSSAMVHLELRTGDLAAAQAFYAKLCGWRPERIETRHGSYLALDVGSGIGGGIVQCPTDRPLWLPYSRCRRSARRPTAPRGLGARVLLEPREGPAGWRSVVATRDAAEIAFWQPKR
jgi:predicted enzyme related to lactoylglutathione lyase